MLAYLAGYIVDKLLEEIKCPLCRSVLESNESDLLDNESSLFIKCKNLKEAKVGLKFPSASVLTLIKLAEDVFTAEVICSGNKSLTLSKITNLPEYLTEKCLGAFSISSNLFPWMSINKLSEKNEHKEELHKRVIHRYLKMRCLSFIPSFNCAQKDHKPSSRTTRHKLNHFLGE